MKGPIAWSLENDGTAEVPELPSSLAAEIAHGVVDTFLDSMNRPAFRAGLGVTMASTIVLAKLGTRPWVTIIAATMLGVTAERLYGMAEDITAKVNPPQLLFHGAGCPGHTTGLPAECCMAGSDATGED